MQLFQQSVNASGPLVNLITYIPNLQCFVGTINFSQMTDFLPDGFDVNDIIAVEDVEDKGHNEIFFTETEASASSNV